MYNNNFQQLINICSKEYANKPYRAQNLIVQKSEIPKQNETINEKVPTNKNQPVNENVPTSEVQPKVSKGYIAVGVFTALGALPVPDAVVTIYTINEAGEENAIYHLITDENGRIPNVELPVIYDPKNPLISPQFYFTTYNMRVQAINYYTVNVLDIRVFPNITTAYKIDLIPVMSGAPSNIPEQTIIIPPSPIDKSND